MRLDKFLKVSRLIKRRTVAKEVCKAGWLSTDRLQAGSIVKVGDGTIRYGHKLVTAQVERFRKQREKMRPLTCIRL